MDAASYTHIRWNDLVRTLLSLGCTEAEAERVARVTMARCWPAWKREDRSGDADVLVYRTLLDAWESSSPPGDPDPDLTARVLTTGVGLSEYQVEEILGFDPGDTSGWPLTGDHWEDLYRGVAPVDSIQDDVRRARRRRTQQATGVLVALVLVLGGVWLLGGGGDDDSSPTHTEAANPIPLPWWNAGVLHLAAMTVPVALVDRLAQAGTGTTYNVVYGDNDGDVVQVDPDGTQTTIGTYVRAAAIVGAADGRVAWVHPEGSTSQLSVWDTTTKRFTVQADLPGIGYEPIAIDGTDVYLRTTTGVVRWSPDGPLAPAPARLLDVADGVTLSAGTSTGINLIAGDGTFAIGAAVHATLSDDGSLLATWSRSRAGIDLETSDKTAAPPPPLILPPNETVLDARFTPDGSLVVVASRLYLLSSDTSTVVSAPGQALLTDLIVCRTDDGSCRITAGRGPHVTGHASPITLPG